VCNTLEREGLKITGTGWKGGPIGGGLKLGTCLCEWGGLKPDDLFTPAKKRLNNGSASSAQGGESAGEKGFREKGQFPQKQKKGDRQSEYGKMSLGLEKEMGCVGQLPKKGKKRVGQMTTQTQREKYRLPDETINCHQTVSLENARFGGERKHKGRRKRMKP